MPLVRIDLAAGKSPDYRRTIGEVVYEAMIGTINVPKDDRFQIIHQHEPGELVFDRHYLGGPRSDDFVLIHITAGWRRSTDVKKAFYQRLVELLAKAPGIRPEDVMVVLNTTHPDDWSFSGGVATIFKERPVHEGGVSHGG